MAELAGVPTLKFHDIRHFAASNALPAGVLVTLVAARLGHSDPSVTLSVYSHTLPPVTAMGNVLYGVVVSRRSLRAWRSFLPPVSRRPTRVR